MKLVCGILKSELQSTCMAKTLASEENEHEYVWSCFFKNKNGCLVVAGLGLQPKKGEMVEFYKGLGLYVLEGTIPHINTLIHCLRFFRY